MPSNTDSLCSAMRRQENKRNWKVEKSTLGRPELRLQDLRHSFANFLVSIGINERELHGILGHYKPETLALVRDNTFGNKGGE